MRHGFILQNAEQHDVKLMCALLEVLRSGYYDWRDRSTSVRSVKNATLTKAIHRAHWPLWFIAYPCCVRA